MSANNKGKKVPMRNLRTLVPPETFAALEMESLDLGVTLAACVRMALMDHVSERDGTPAPPLPESVSNEEWGAIKAWTVTAGLAVPPEHRSSRRAVLAWARREGYER